MRDAILRARRRERVASAPTTPPSAGNRRYTEEDLALSCEPLAVTAR
jgi:hypothetical protein